MAGIGTSHLERDSIVSFVQNHLLIISERIALAWILSQEQMAFPTYRARSAARLAEGDRLFIYTTRGCFHNPTRDRGRVAAIALMAGSVTVLNEPRTVGGREFGLLCDITVTGVAPLREGVELQSFQPPLDLVASSKNWAVSLRTPVLRLTLADADRLAERLGSLTRPRSEVIDDYIQAGIPVRRRTSAAVK
jgi:hypothetical protein